MNSEAERKKRHKSAALQVKSVKFISLPDGEEQLARAYELLLNRAKSFQHEGSNSGSGTAT